MFAATVVLRGSVLASSNPLELNGGSCLAMAGKDCVALAVDRRFGLEGQLVSTEAKRVLKVRGVLLVNRRCCLCQKMQRPANYYCCVGML